MHPLLLSSVQTRLSHLVSPLGITFLPKPYRDHSADSSLVRLSGRPHRSIIKSQSRRGKVSTGPAGMSTSDDDWETVRPQHYPYFHLTYCQDGVIILSGTVLSLTRTRPTWHL